MLGNCFSLLQLEENSESNCYRLLASLILWQVETTHYPAPTPTPTPNGKDFLLFKAQFARKYTQ